MYQFQAALPSIEKSSIATMSMLQAAGAGTLFWNALVCQQVDQKAGVLALCIMMLGLFINLLCKLC
jgi:hypothetical protein